DSAIPKGPTLGQSPRHHGELARQPTGSQHLGRAASSGGEKGSTTGRAPSAGEDRFLKPANGNEDHFTTRKCGWAPGRGGLSWGSGSLSSLDGSETGCSEAIGGSWPFEVAGRFVLLRAACWISSLGISSGYIQNSFVA